MNCKISNLIVLVLVVLITIGSSIEVKGGDKKNLLCESEDVYSYADMVYDINTLIKMYPNYMRADSIGETLDGREIYHISIGEESATDHVLVFASIHAREYITTQLVMKQVNDFLKNIDSEIVQYKGMSYRELLNGVTIDIVPMVNPDGVTLSQYGIEGLLKSSTRQKVYRIYELDEAIELKSHLKKWKSNAEGVDINRNFDALWSMYDDHLGHPSADHYKGETVACTAEAKALIELTEKYRFKRTISYHVQGEVIYWYFGQNGNLLDESKEFAQSISKVTGYPLDGNYEKLDPAGYKDWAIQKKGIPSLTIEVGRGEVPLDLSQLPDIYEKNKNVLKEMLYSIK